MFRKIMVMALLVCLMALPAMAIGVEGDGWWDGNFNGYDFDVDDSGMVVRIPFGWMQTGSGTFQGDDGATRMEVEYYGDMELYDFYVVIEPEYSDYDEQAEIILQQDRDWIIYAGPSLMDACGEASFGGTLHLRFEMPDTESAFATARRIISSARSYDGY